MTAVIEDAPAKINLTLEVLGRRNDGMHELRSLVAFARDATDRIVLQPGDDTTFAARGPFAGAIVGENSVMSTIDVLRKRGFVLGSITLEKNLPVASGIGGGSADAAALLRAARRANPRTVVTGSWHDIAAGLGADVPACLASAALLMTGTGCTVERLQQFPPLHAVLVNPMVAVPIDKTARVYRALGLAPGSAAASPAAPPRDLADAAALIAYVSRGENELREAALAVVPEIAEVLSCIRAQPHVSVARLSGGGPTCFGLFGTLAQARTAADSIHAAHPTWWVRPTRLG